MGRKLTTEEFIEKAKSVHGDKYDYSTVLYVRMDCKVVITCYKHGQFSQTPSAHIKGNGCPTCAIIGRGLRKRTPVDEFLKRSTDKHGDLYDYSLVNSVMSDTKVSIICKSHGTFYQTPSVHYRSGCPKCSKSLRKTTEDFLESAETVHGRTYDYSKVNIINYSTKVEIICKTHGMFKQTPELHLSGSGCPTCYGSTKKTTGSYIEELRNLYGDRYNYSKVVYSNNRSKITLDCKIHGEFHRNASNLLQGMGCQKCGTKESEVRRRLSFDSFIARSKQIHNDKYDYSKVIYADAKQKVKIVCPIHGEFEQCPDKHLRNQGCPSCSETGFRIERPSVLYLYEFGEFLGFGISNKHRNRRAQHIRNLIKANFVPISTHVFKMSGEQALELETKIKKEYKHLIVSSGVDGFRTECVRIEDKPIVEKVITDYLTLLQNYDKPSEYSEGLFWATS